MISNLFKVAFRNFIRDKFYTVLNISGLAIGIGVSLLIVVYMLNELSYDRFHTKADRIHRLVSHLEMGSNSFDGNAVFPPLAAALRSEMPEVELAVRISQSNSILIREKAVAFNEQNIYFADPDFFKLFDFALIAGDKETALNDRYRIVLTPALAEKYFKSRDWQQIIGQSIQLDDDVYQVTGIVDDAPANSHFHYAAIGSMESRPAGRDEAWDNMNVSTYLLLKEGTKVEDVVSKIPAIIESQNPGFMNLVNQGIILNFSSQALTSIHLHSNVQGDFEPNSDIMTLYIFSVVAIIVLLLACVNFINLTTARSANRAKEVGVRKVLGSAAFQLIRQFTTESIILVGIATLIALGLIELARIPFNALTGTELSLGVILNPEGILCLLGFIVALGILAGSYPSLFLSRLKPAVVLKGNVRSGFKNSSLRNSLVTLQFIISIGLITCTLIVQQQLEFMRSKKLGFDKENVLTIRNANRVDSQQALANELLQLPSIKSVSTSEFRPIDDYDGTVAVTDEDKENRKLVSTCHADYDYIPSMQFELVNGRNFSRDFPSDSAAVIVNEVAASYLFESEAIGKKVYLADNQRSRALTVVGIVKNFNFQSLKNEITPLVFMLEENQQLLHVRLNPGDYQQAVAQIEMLWAKHADVSFDYSFMDESFDNLFKGEAKLGTLFSIFTGLALAIACLGLLGLAAYMSEQRSKELSIRKVLGATLFQVVILLSKDFIRLIVLAALLAFPVAYYVMNLWLATYAYRISMSFSLFIISGTLVLVVALLTVSYQSIKAALINPVVSLKSE